MFGSLKRKLKGGFGVGGIVKVNPVDWFIIAVTILFCCLMLLYALAVLFPDLGLAFWK